MHRRAADLRRGGPRRRRRLGRRAAHRAARGLRARADRRARQREVLGRAARPPSSTGSWWRSTTSTRSTGSSAWPARGPQRVLLRVIPDVRSETHARRRDRPGRLEVRRRAGRGAPPRSSGCAPPAGPTSRGCTCTSARSSSTSRRTARRSRRSRSSALPGVRPRRRARRRLHRRAPAAVGRRVGRGRGRRGARAARRAGGRAWTSPGARWSPTRASRSTPSSRSSATSRPGWRSTAG